jgi:hypothetical protein
MPEPLEYGLSRRRSKIPWWIGALMAVAAWVFGIVAWWYFNPDQRSFLHSPFKITVTQPNR